MMTAMTAMAGEDGDSECKEDDGHGERGRGGGDEG